MLAYTTYFESEMERQSKRACIQIFKAVLTSMVTDVADSVLSEFKQMSMGRLAAPQVCGLSPFTTPMSSTKFYSEDGDNNSEEHHDPIHEFNTSHEEEGQSEVSQSEMLESPEADEIATEDEEAASDSGKSDLYFEFQEKLVTDSETVLDSFLANEIVKEANEFYIAIS